MIFRNNRPIDLQTKQMDFHWNPIYFWTNIYQIECYDPFYVYPFSAYLSQSLKWAFLIIICSLSVVVVGSGVVVNFSNFLPLQNHLANFNWT